MFDSAVRCVQGHVYKYLQYSFKVAYTSGPIFEKIIKRYPIFSFIIQGHVYKYLQYSFKVAYTSGPIFEKIIKRYPIFSLQINYYQIVQKHK